MGRLNALDEIREDLEIYVEKTAKEMGDSAVCMSIFTDNYKKGIDSLLQFAIALMLEKPIYLLVPTGTTVPAKIARIADGIEFYNPDMSDILEASKKLLEKVYG